MHINFETALTDFPKYIESFKSEFFNNKIIHVHIPKTAGTSFLSIVRSLYDKERIKTIDWKDIHANFDKFLIEWDTGKEYDFITGHFRHYDFSKLDLRNVPYKVITFLRHPIERLISEYRYMCTEVHPWHEKFKKDHPNFESFVMSDMVIPNSLSKILVGEFKTVYEVLEKMKEKYLFIGLSEYYHFYSNLLYEGIGMKYIPGERKNVTKSNPSNKIEIEYSLYQKLNNIHQIDIQLYDYFYRSTSKIVNDYIKYKATTP